MKTPEQFYEDARQAGFTDAITSNTNPDYTMPFYQSIFALMKSYSKYSLEEIRKDKNCYYCKHSSGNFREDPCRSCIGLIDKPNFIKY